MLAYLGYAAELLLLYIVLFNVRDWWSWRKLNRWGEQHGCGEAPTVKNKYPGGLERYAIFFKGMKDLDFLEDIIRARANSMGAYTYRTFGLFNRSMITTSDPQNIQAILATQFTDFDLGPSRRDNFHTFIGNGIFTAEGAAWSHYRAQLKPQFTRDQVSDLESAALHLNHLFAALPAEDEDGWTPEVDLMPMIYRFTMDVSTEFLFGTSVNSQSTAASAIKTASQEENAKFAEAMNYAQEYISWRIRLGKLYWMFNSKRFQQSCATVKSFADKFVERALERAQNTDLEGKSTEGKEGKEGKKEKFILLDALLTETRDPTELRDQVLQTLLAGRDTTASLISWVLLLLSRDPAQYTSLRTTILSHFGTSSNPKQPLTFSTLKSCKEITHILYETLRLYPLVPLNGRMALKTTTLPTGGGPHHDQPIVVKKGEQVGYSSYVLQRREDIWGKDADEWRPERWEGRKLGWEWVAFSGGPRVCLGQQYALTEAAFVLVGVVRRFDRIEAINMKAKIRKGLSITLSPMDGVRVRLHRAEGEV